MTTKEAKLIEDVLNIITVQGEIAVTVLIKKLQRKGWRGLHTAGSIMEGIEDTLKDLGFTVKRYYNQDNTVRKTTVSL